jgi:hypothetical protein
MQYDQYGFNHSEQLSVSRSILVGYHQIGYQPPPAPSSPAITWPRPLQRCLVTCGNLWDAQVLSIIIISWCMNVYIITEYVWILMMENVYIYTGWWLSHPFEKNDLVSWDYENPNWMGKIKNVPNHQPVIIYIYKWLWWLYHGVSMCITNLWDPIYYPIIRVLRVFWGSCTIKIFYSVR